MDGSLISRTLFVGIVMVPVRALLGRTYNTLAINIRMFLTNTHVQQPCIASIPPVVVLRTCINDKTQSVFTVNIDDNPRVFGLECKKFPVSKVIRQAIRQCKVVYVVRKYKNLSTARRSLGHMSSRRAHRPLKTTAVTLTDNFLTFKDWQRPWLFDDT